MITVKPLDKPEPTTIDESDLADGMVVGVKSEWSGLLYICTPDAVSDVFIYCSRMVASSSATTKTINNIAGVTP